MNSLLNVIRLLPSLSLLFVHFQIPICRHGLTPLVIPTYTGTSKRIFPQKGIKPIQVLNAILKVLKDKNVKLHTGYTWQGEKMDADITVFALGGSSWKITGSDGTWARYFQNKGIEIVPFQASNCVFQINWPKNLTNLAAGLPLKNIALKSLDVVKNGEVVILNLV